MKRTIATLGVLGLAAFTVAAPASAASEKVTVCHASGNGIYDAVSISLNALAGHELHLDDIVPPNDVIGARNWNAAGIAVHAANCVAAAVPVVVVPPIVVDPPPVVVPPIVVEQPVVEQPVVNQPVVEQPVVNQPVVEQPVVNQPVVEQPAVVPPAAAPSATAPKVTAPKATVKRQAPAAGAAAAPAATSRGTNQGYNAQTAVGGPESSPSWLAGLGALMAAGAAVAVRRRSRTLPLGG